MKNKLFSTVMLLVLLLTGCKEGSSSITKSEEPSVPSAETSVDIEDSSEAASEYAGLIGMDTYNDWPSAAIDEYLLSHNVEEKVPALPNVTRSYVELTLDDPNFEHYLTVFIPGTNQAEDYTAILQAVNYQVVYYEEDDYYIGLNSETTIQIDYFYVTGDADYPDGMFIFIEALATNGGGTIVIPEGIPSVIDFATEDQITKRDALQSIWTTESGVTMTIDKGASTVNVGNLTTQNEVGYFTNPLRIYAGQVVTFTVPAEVQINAVLLETAGAWEKGDSVLAVTNSAPETVDFIAEGDNVLFTLFSPSNTLTFSLAAQARFNKITVFVI